MRERALVRVGARGRVPRVGARGCSVAAPHPSRISPVHDKEKPDPYLRRLVLLYIATRGRASRMMIWLRRARASERSLARGGLFALAREVFAGVRARERPLRRQRERVLHRVAR